MLAAMRTGLFVLVALFLVGVWALDGSADRPRRPRGRRPAAASAAAPRSAEIAKAMGDLGWGMTHAQVIDQFTKRIQEEYRPRIAKAPGTIEQDALQHEVNGKIERLRRSYVAFTGQQTGWEVSFLGEEFTHNNGEAMLNVPDPGLGGQRFFFFIGDRLWKLIIAFDHARFEGRTFEQFGELIQTRYGPARRIERQRAGEKAPSLAALEWQDPTSVASAVDYSTFYGFFALRFVEKRTLGNLAALRKNVAKRRTGFTASVEQVMAPDQSPIDRNADVVDRLAGHAGIGAPPAQGAPTPNAPAAPSSSTATNPAAVPPPTTTTSTGNADDPLRGLNL